MERNMRSWCLFRCKRGSLFIGLFIFITVVLSTGNSLVLAQNDATVPVLRSSIYKLRHIPAKDAKNHLIDLKIGRDINQIANLNALIVSSYSSAELTKVTSLLEMVDSEQPFAIQTILENPLQVPKNAEIAAKLGLAIGTFSEPPTGVNIPKAIIDIHNSDLIAIAPENLLGSIAKAVKQLQGITDKAAGHVEPSGRIKPSPEPMEADLPSAKALIDDFIKVRTKAEVKDSARTVAEVPAVTPPAQKDDFFGAELLESLVEAEQKTARKTKAKPQPAVVPPVRQIDKTVPPKINVKNDKVLKELSDSSQDKLIEAFKALMLDKADEQPVKPQAAEPEPQEALEPSQPEPQVPKQPSIEYSERLAIPEAEKELELTLTLPEKVEVTALVELVGKQLGLNYIYDPKKITGEVMLKVHDGKIKVRDTYALLESVLKFKGFVMTRRGTLVTIVPAVEAMQIDPTFRTTTEDIRPGDGIVTTIFQLQHITTDSAQNLLKNMNLGASVQPIKENNTLIVTGYAFRMQRIEELLKMVDLPGRPREFRFRQLQYTIASNLAPKVKALAEQLGTVSVSVSAKAAAPARPTRGRPTPPKPPAKSAGTPRKDGVYLDTDDRTNRILMIGLDEDIEVVNELIDALDVQQQDLRTIRQYEIRNVGAEEVQDKLGELGIISGTASRSRTRRTSRSSSSSSKSTSQSPASTSTDAADDEPQVIVLESTNSLLVNATAEQHAKIVMIIAYVDAKPDETTTPYVVYSLENQNPEDLAATLEKVISETTKTEKDGKIQTTTTQRDEDIISIVPDLATFSLIVYASKRNQQWIGSLIETLDKYLAQVLIDVTLVEITRDDAFQYDLDLVTKFPDLARGGTMDSLTALLSPFPDKTIREATSKTSTGTTNGFYADRHIQALLTLVQTKKYGRVLAQPKILVNDNETGSISTDKTTYVSRSSSSATTAGEPVVSSTTTFDEFTSGITLEITPHISQGDLLRLEIKMERGLQDSASGSTANTPPPDRTDNVIGTVVTVPDKSTIILGGVQELNQDKDGNKIPLLGDIPLIGGLFRGINNSDKQTKLYIFVKANILRPSETEPGLPELVAESKGYRAAFEEAEQDWQEYENWPGIKPEPVKPLKFLDVK